MVVLHTNESEFPDSMIPPDDIIFRGSGMLLMHSVKQMLILAVTSQSYCLGKEGGVARWLQMRNQDSALTGPQAGSGRRR